MSISQETTKSPPPPPALRVGWWNVGLRGPGRRVTIRSKNDGKRWHLTTEVVHELLRTIDVLILGEIDDEDLFSMCPNGYESLPTPGTSTSGIGVLFDPARARVLQRGGTAFRARDRELRLIELSVTHPKVEQRIELLGVHFPSHLHETQEALRRVFAADLGREIKLRRGAADAHLVVIGDFNDEPFSESMQGQLRGVRERDLVYTDRARELLYNPFWRKLGERHPAGRCAPSFSPAGTYFWRKNAVNGQRWYTFDQMLVTAAFLGGHGWTLDEEHTDILCPESLFAETSLKHAVDHLPIIGEFSYLSERGALQ